MAIDGGQHNRNGLLAYIAFAIAIIAIIALFYSPIGSIFFGVLSIFLAWRSSINIFGGNRVLLQRMAKPALVLALILSLFAIVSSGIAMKALPTKYKVEKVYDSGIINHK